MGPVEAAQTPENATMTVPLRDVPQAGNQPQFRPSIQDALRQPAGYGGWVAEPAHLRPQIGTEPAVLICYITS